MANKTTDKLELRVNETSEGRQNATELAINVLNDCLQRQANNVTSECDKLQEAADAVVNLTVEQAEATADLFNIEFLFKIDKQYQSLLQSKINSLEREISDINTQLDHLQADQVYLGEVVESLNELNEKSKNDFGDHWTKFSYDSETQSTDTAFDAVGTLIFNFTSVDLGFGFTKLDKYTRLKVSGELLCVSIKRPWFKPSLFDNPTFNFVSQATS